MREKLISAFFSVLRATATMGRAAPASASGAATEPEIEADRARPSDASRGRDARGPSGGGEGRRWATRALAGVRVALWAAIGTALSADEKSRLGVALYDAGDEYRDTPRHAWEDAWHARWLPSGPRPRVLVGAAGAGREVLALLDRGCEVVAVEPSPALAALCRARTEGRVTVIEGRYEDLVLHDFFLVGGERDAAPASVKAPTDSARPAVPDGPPAEGDVQRATGDVQRATGDVQRAAGDVQRATGDVQRATGDVQRGEALAFDAVLLGLGSLSHVLDAAARARLLETLARACPRGPILASALAPPRGIEAPREGRAARMGRAAARPIRAARHLPPIEAGEIVFDALGFAKLFTRDELTALGAACGRRTIFDDGAPEGVALCAFVPA